MVKKRIHALYAIHSLLTQIRFISNQSYYNERIGELLDYAEMLPRFLASDIDETDEFVKYLEAIVKLHPPCSYILERFNTDEVPENW